MMGGEYMDEFYKGYKLLKGTTEEINNYMENIDTDEWYVNEYLIIYNTDDESEKEMRWDGQQFVGLKLPPSRFIKGKNALQRCALDMLNNRDITVCALLGLPGSGKSYLSIQSAIYCIKEKGFYQGVVTCREPVSSGRTSGYLPGTLDEKIGLYFKPIEEQLDGGEFELRQMQQRGEIESITPHYVKGRTFTSKYVIIEEAEDITQKQIRLLGTRIGEGSKIIFSGDHKQSEINTGIDNDLLRMCSFFKGNPKFASIFLEDDVRSETSKMFASMYF